MADSDDEYDRKRRDKFRGERSAGGGGGGGGGGAGENYRSDRREDRGRGEWQDRNPFRGGRGRPEYRDYRQGGGGGATRERFSPERGGLPPAKRMRPDWGDDLRGRYAAHEAYGIYGWGGHDAYPMAGMHGFGGGHIPGGMPAREPAINSDTQTQPAMLTLKQYLDTQDDNISDSEVLKKYGEYKLEFKRQQLNEFFVAHKDEEWFKNKYHPEECIKRKEEQQGFLKGRIDVFNELLEDGTIPAVTVDTNQSDLLLRLLDTAVIKLEGGTEEDLKVLDEKPPPPEVKIREKTPPYEPRVAPKVEIDDDVIITEPKTPQKTYDDDDGENWDDEPAEEVKPKDKSSDGADIWDDDDMDEGPKKQIQDELNGGEKEEKKSKKRKRSQSESSDSSTDSEKSDKSNKSDKSEKSVESKTEDKEELEAEKPSEEVEDTKGGIVKDQEEAKKVEADESEKLPIEDDAKSDAGGDDLEKLEKEDGEESKEDEKKDDESTAKPSEETTETIDVEKEPFKPAPRYLHRTSSIFLRNLAPTITKSEIEGVCKKFDGYLRVAIADPLVERRWFRRGWVTFKRDVNIKEICWNLNNIRLRDCEMGAIVNRDLSRRVRPVNGITAHKTIVRSDIKLCAKITMNMDEKFQLWLDSTELNDSKGRDLNGSFGFKSNNPVLQNITDFLIEEASAEEDELLGLSSGDNKDIADGEQLERDPELITVLDKLILYLRIVHSIDFYNHCEYPYEDEMPNRCGIIHARGPAPQNRISANEMQEYVKNFEGKMQSFLAKPTSIEEEELKKMGCKDPEAEVEKFIQANTQELAKDKWLCPLSGKKFKGPDFIRKHIFNKHAEKVEEVRKEVEYYNNYLKDPKRPQLPEHPGSARRTPAEPAAAAPGFRGAFPPAGYAPPYASYAPPMIMPPRTGGRGYGGGRREFQPEHQRRVVGYHDLDAPTNFDLFD